MDLKTHRGFTAYVTFVEESNDLWFGHIENVKLGDVICFGPRPAAEMQASFEEAVDDYLDLRGADNDEG